MNLTIPILAYHQISNDPHPNYLNYTVTTRSFKTQIKILKLLNFTPITMSQLVDYKEMKIKLPNKPIIITFDDAMQEAIDHAIPILNDAGFPAVFFIITDYLGRNSSWMLPEVNVEFPVIDWHTVKKLDTQGFEIGSHTMNHPWLDRISPDDCHEELEGSRKKLQDALGHEIRHIAYPFGSYNNTTLRIAIETGYLTGCTTEQSIAYSNRNMFELPRLNVGVYDSLLDFIIKIHTAKTPIRVIKHHMMTLGARLPGPLKKFIKRHLFNGNAS